MKAPQRRRAADGWGSPQGHRFISSILVELDALPEERQVDALRKAPRSLRQLLYFTFGPFDLELPRGELTYSPISTEAYVVTHRDAPDEDLLAAEVHKLVRLFARGVHPTLTPERRLTLWQDVLDRLPASERELLDYIRVRRRLPYGNISRETVALAFPGMLDAPPAPDAPVQGIEYVPTAMDNEQPIAEAPKPGASREPTASELAYASMMRRMGWGNV